MWWSNSFKLPEPFLKFNYLKLMIMWVFKGKSYTSHKFIDLMILSLSIYYKFKFIQSIVDKEMVPKRPENHFGLWRYKLAVCMLCSGIS